MFDNLCESPPSLDDPAVYHAWLFDMDKLYRKALKEPTEESQGWMDAIRIGARLENQGAAAQLVGIGRLFGYRLARNGETADWCIDTVEAGGAAGTRVLCMNAIFQTPRRRSRNADSSQRCAFVPDSSVTLPLFT